MIFATGGGCLAYPESLYSPPPHVRSTTGVAKKMLIVRCLQNSSG